MCFDAINRLCAIHSAQSMTGEDMECVVRSIDTLEGSIRESLLQDRRKQFVDRLGWNLCVSPEGYETDEYDVGKTTVLAVHQNGRHIGSCRLRHPKAGTMLADHFGSEFPSAQNFLNLQRNCVWELTRFCRSPTATALESKLMLKILARQLDNFRDEHRLIGFAAVVYPEVARFLRSIGVRYLHLTSSTIDNRPVQLICITHCVSLDERRELSSPGSFSTGIGGVSAGHHLAA